MRRAPISFASAGVRLDGDLYVPEDLVSGERRPALLVCSGYQGLKDMHPARFARAFVPEGYVCLAFDYRGFGRSEGRSGACIRTSRWRTSAPRSTFSRPFRRWSPSGSPCSAGPSGAGS